MKRFHVHVNADQIDSSIRFHTTLFGVAPSVVKRGYAKWMLDDPRVNFAISQHGRQAGLDHLGMQADNDVELAAIGERLQAADAITPAEKGTTCCYAHSGKFWAEDPQGVRWESFRTHGEAPSAAAVLPKQRTTKARLAAVRHRQPRAPPPRAAAAPSVPAAEVPMQTQPCRVLFLCTGNSARSIMAEALLNVLGAGRFKAYSAGSFPSGKVQPIAAEMAQAFGYTEPLRSKSWDEFAEPGSPSIDFVITVCDNAAGEVCPIWPGQPVTAHWGVPDPAAVTGSEDVRRRAFRSAWLMLRQRIELLLVLPLGKLDRTATQRELHAVGQETVHEH